MLGSIGKDTVIAGVDEAGEKIIRPVTETVTKAAAGLEAALAAAVDKGGVDAALLVNATLLEMQAWRFELEQWRKTIAPLAGGFSVIPLRAKED